MEKGKHGGLADRNHYDALSTERTIANHNEADAEYEKSIFE